MLNLKIYSIVALAFLLIACQSDPNIALRESVQAGLGRDFDNVFRFHYHREPQQTKISNGNIEYRYVLVNGSTCTAVYEVNPVTNIVVKVSFEGTGKVCP